MARTKVSQACPYQDIDITPPLSAYCTALGALHGCGMGEGNGRLSYVWSPTRMPT